MQTQLVEQPPGVCAAEGLLVAASIKDSLQRTSPCLLAWCQPVRCGPREVRPARAGAGLGFEFGRGLPVL